MSASFRATSIAMALCVLVVSCDRPGRKSQLAFDTSYTAPIYWKLVEEGMWGLRFNVPLALREVGYDNDLWIHEGTQLRVIVDFDHYPASDSLKRKPNYSEVRLSFNGLPALVCSYDQPNAAPGSLKRVVALVFLEKRKVLGAGHEPWYRVEYSSDDDRTTALQILQTVRFYDS